MNKQVFSIPATDGYALAASLYTSDESVEKRIIVCNAGTCIPQPFYEEMAIWLSAQGFDVFTYDYRGVGLSKPKHLKGFRGGITDWAVKDMEGVFSWVEKKYPLVPKYLLAHSMGGQIMGLAPSVTLFEKIITIASSYGNYRFYAKKFKNQATRLRYMIPIANYWYGYFPAKLAGDSFGEDWAHDVGRDWVEWGKYSLPFSQIASLKKWVSYFPEIKAPLLAIFIEDDIIATPTTIPYYQTDFPNARLEIKRLNTDLQEKIGHFGFFKKKNGTQYWENVLEWINSSSVEK